MSTLFTLTLSRDSPLSREPVVCVDAAAQLIYLLCLPACCQHKQNGKQIARQVGEPDGLFGAKQAKGLACPAQIMGLQ
jgi:hypothetical protein